jgi:hypothetical protein
MPYAGSLALMEAVSHAFSAWSIADSRNAYLPKKPNLSLLILLLKLKTTIKTL